MIVRREHTIWRQTKENTLQKQAAVWDCRDHLLCIRRSRLMRVARDGREPEML